MTPEWVTSPERFCGRVGSLWRGVFWDGVSSIHGVTVIPLWEHGIPRQGEDGFWVGFAMVLRVTSGCVRLERANKWSNYLTAAW